MKPAIPRKDLEQLSAHLDGSLSEREQAALAARLAAEPALAAARRQLELTRAMLRRAPQRKTPRSFTLTAAMASQGRGRLGAWSGFNFASAAASLALILVLLTDFSLNGLPLPAAASGAVEAPQALMAEAPAEADTALAPEPSPEAFTLEQPPAADEGAGEISAKRSLSASEWIAENARTLEALLASLAVISGVLAWHRRRN
jgi:negative regulator of sigma E activity